MFLFYSFMRLWTKCVNKCLHENEFFHASYVHILSCRCRYMRRYICRCTCRCGCVDVHMQIVFPYASVYRTRALILNFRSKRLLVVFTTVRLLKSPLNTKISKFRQNRCLQVIRFTRNAQIKEKSQVNIVLIDCSHP